MERPFTTHPRTRRHGNFISGDRCRVFMEHCWEKGLRKKASWATLEFEFVQCFQTNDSRTVNKYIGQVEAVIRKSGSSMVRQNRSQGKIAQFSYSTTRRISRKSGLLETLGYITYSNDGYYRLNHELLPHHTQQLEFTHESVNPPALLHQEVKECSEVFIDDLRVCCGGETNDNVNAMESEVTTLGGEEKEEEVIESTHTNPYLYPNMTRRVCDMASDAIRLVDNNDRAVVVRRNDSMKSLKAGE